MLSPRAKARGIQKRRCRVVESDRIEHSSFHCVRCFGLSLRERKNSDSTYATHRRCMFTCRSIHACLGSLRPVALDGLGQTKYPWPLCRPYQRHYRCDSPRGRLLFAAFSAIKPSNLDTFRFVTIESRPSLAISCPYLNQSGTESLVAWRMSGNPHQSDKPNRNFHGQLRGCWLHAISFLGPDKLAGSAAA